MTKIIKVLLVDDEERFRITTAKILERMGFQTMGAASGEEALGKLGEAPDVVVLDIRMQGMDGEATLMKIKEQRPEIPVIMLTGHGERPSAEQAVVQGAFDYLTKPADIDLLVCKIREAFRFGGAAKIDREKVVGDLMIPIQKCLVLSPESTLGEAILRLQVSRQRSGNTKKIMQAGQQSVLVFKDAEIVGAVAMGEIVEAVRPLYLSNPELRSRAASTTWRFSNIFWNGLFTQRLKELSEIPLGGIMTLPPPPIKENGSLMEACDLMHETSARRLVVMNGASVVGVLREQELFEEMVQVILAG